MGKKVEVIKFNPENWVSSEAVVEIDRTKGEFEVNGYRFKMVAHPTVIDVDMPRYNFDNFLCYPVSDAGSVSEHHFCNISKFAKDDEWCAINPTLSREDADPYLAAAKMVCSLY